MFELDKDKYRLLALEFLRRNEGHITLYGSDCATENLEGADIEAVASCKTIDVEFYLIDKNEAARRKQEDSILIPAANELVRRMIANRTLGRTVKYGFTGFKRGHEGPFTGQIYPAIRLAEFRSINIPRESLADLCEVAAATKAAIESLEMSLRPVQESHVGQE